MPALYFSILLFAVGFDLFTIRLMSRKRLMVAGLWILSVIYVYRCFIPITYAEPWTQSLCEKAKWRSTWDFNCAEYHHDIESYNIKKPLIIEGIDKMKSVVSSYWANHPAEVAGVVNIVSDAINVPNSQQSENIEQIDFTTGTQ
ncbi:hypothetical protein G6F55_012996 [Rhizopus delemar]|nr:hypothetical protein G6F55_012996 [Rhizopus delemar]KAG1536327.1 hypothetical protein G6F51_011032 [Rhizopus arrhizus]KAG1491771.1 hypothetical protein G6F54_009776 [Rhizopus delemar]KAG1497785.1 hypothetical protein G6F52_012818 [Rhizopus delemar]KAG1506095.1 hypothetical protein G6F53_009940 [Rhizopus delemar]